ncbi:glycoside hydrolase domain-containing protein [Lacticaseibacillus paracasei]|uniref:glycoside hydrolase domain-containing protein n=1 Tax=Lacticaseibacillus paracasei TaxID=1597 RepID=UPI0031F5382E
MQEGRYAPLLTPHKNNRYLSGNGYKNRSPGSEFNQTFSIATVQAFKALQQNAGINVDGVVTVNLMAALFDMAAFTLIAGGSAKVRSMQQYLNGRFSNNIGILPCDGIYQRDTNTALIYALQRAEGLSADTATGTYGQKTIDNCPVLSEGSKDADAVRVLQYGLLVNGFTDIPTNGQFTSAVGDAVAAFSTMMNLDPTTGRIAGNRVIKGLLTSNGDTTRDSIACDTSKQLTSADVATLHKYGFSIVGRYLTGSVGNAFTPKNLTTSEIKAITNGGMSVFPIYQDGGAEIEYFTETQGVLDAMTAASAARVLGFPNNTIIYFACDVDIQEGNINATIIAYMRGINSGLAKSGYRAGIYGTRNVCAHVLKAGYAVRCFVSDMSTGYSGNLGYAMPMNWSFDQFIEYSIGNIPIDQVATDVKISDPGTKTFTPGVLPEDSKKVVASDLLQGLINNLLTFELGKEYTLPVQTPHVEAFWSVNSSAGNGAVHINKGGFDKIELHGAVEDQVGKLNNPVAFDETLDKYGIVKLGAKVDEGSFNVAVKTNGENLEVSLTLNIIKAKKISNVDVNMSITWRIVFTPLFWYDHPEISPAKQKSYAFGAALDLSSYMGTTYLVAGESSITASFIGIKE